MRRIYPMPEALGLDVRVQSGGGSMNNVDRLMRVPLVDTPAARHIRAHEMTHAKYSPTEPLTYEGLPGVAVQRAEDMRMNVYGLRSGLDDALGAPMIEDAEEVERIVCKSPLDARTAMCSTFNTGDWPLVLDAAAKVFSPEDLAATVKRIEDAWADLSGRPEPSWADTLRIAESLADNAPPEPEPNGKGSASDNGEGSGTGEPEPAEPSEPADEPQDTEPGESPADEPTDASESPEADGRPLVPFKPTEDPLDVQAERELAADVPEPPPTAKAVALDELADNNVRFAELPLTRKLTTRKLKQRAYRPSDMGRVPRNMHRYASDRAIFNERGKRRLQAGSILIDCSYVTGMDDGKLERLLEFAPASTIATYKGCWVDQRGELWVLARDGRRTEQKALVPTGIACNCCNAADIPVLKWLLAQDGPHIWLCRDDPGTWEDSGAAKTAAERNRLLKRVTRFEAFEDLEIAVRGGHIR